jgi:hypothetical protein
VLMVVIPSWTNLKKNWMCLSFALISTLCYTDFSVAMPLQGVCFVWSIAGVSLQGNSQRILLHIEAKHLRRSGFLCCNFM